MQFTKIASFVALAASASVAAEEKRLFHVTGPRAMFDAARVTFPELDIWAFRSAEDDQVTADIYTYANIIEQLAPKTESAEFSITVEESSMNIAQQIADEKATNLACQSRTTGFLETPKDAAKYTANAFFDCWRPYDQLFAFMDKVTQENPSLVTKTYISKTVEGRDIPVFKISTGADRKKSIYVQGMLHAREWHAGSTTAYVAASFVDLLNAKDGVVTKFFEEYDWYFVPLVNIDGYKYSWDSNRMWRKNRRQNAGGSYGVDLNRNFGPAQYWNKAGDSPRSDTYPGTSVLSEPESSGIFAFLKTLPGLSTAIDIHTYSALVLRPFGNQPKEAPEPFGTKLKNLGNAVRDGIQRGNNIRYTSQTSQQLYYAYGTFTDSIFMELNVPSLTFELEGRSFVQPESAIRPVGQRIAEGLKALIPELKNYYS